MDVEYIDEQDPEPIRIDEGYYYSLPTPKPKVIVKSRITLHDFNRITKNTSPAKVDTSTFDEYFKQIKKYRC